MRDVAVVGLPFAGKSTVFRAVTRAAESQRGNVAVVSVPDQRVDELGRLHDSAKLVYAQVRLTDVPGLDARALAAAREADALAVVLKGFDDASPQADLESFRAEMAVADLATVEKVLDRARRQAKTGAAAAKAEAQVYERAEQVLSGDKWLSEAQWDDSERRLLALTTPLTLKPVLHVLNSDEGYDGSEPGLPSPVVVIRGLVEAEAAELSEQEASELLAEFGVTEPAATRFLRGVYGLLDLLTFYTAGDTESRAWEVARGAKAPQAAGRIHSDMERGFIRCEAVSYDELVSAGSWDAAREAGKLRVEGRDYVMRDGDVVHIRHSG